MSGDPLFSIVIPTYQRRDVLLRTMAGLARLEHPWPCELVVVVDGSQDGSAEAARAVPMPYDVSVVEQPNSGAAAARNRGAREARGTYLLFLDDDMVADPHLLVAHAERLEAGADAVVGHIPLHPESPRTLLTLGVERWVDRRHERLRRPGSELTLGDLLTGQLSVRASLFHELDGFDEHFNEGGSFGAEDTDVLHRLLSSGARVAYAGDAVTHQHYVVAPAQYLRQWRQGGRADAVLIRKHPDLAARVLDQHGAGSLSGRAVRFLAGRVDERRLQPLTRRVLRRADSGRTDLPTRWLFARVRDLHYWQGLDGGVSAGRPGSRRRRADAAGTARDAGG
jgi:glycosyltransferase involved in cell wall biosynthesis